MPSNILYETVKEGLWGISSQGIRSETPNSVNFSLYIKSHWSHTKEQLQIRSTKTPLWGASVRINEHWYTFAHSVLPQPQLHCGTQHKPINDAQKPRHNASSQPKAVELHLLDSLLIHCQLSNPVQNQELGVKYMHFCSPLFHRLSLLQRLKLSKKLLNIPEGHPSHTPPTPKIWEHRWPTLVATLKMGQCQLSLPHRNYSSAASDYYNMLPVSCLFFPSNF